MDLSAPHLLAIFAGLLTGGVGALVLMARPKGRVNQAFFVLAASDGSTTVFYELHLMLDGARARTNLASAYVASFLVFVAALFAFAFLFLIGYTLAVYAVGRAIVGSERHAAVALLAGCGIATIVSIVPVLNAVVLVAGSVVGVGAAAVAIWRVRDVGRGRHRSGVSASWQTPSDPT